MNVGHHPYPGGTAVWCDACEVHHICIEDHGPDGHSGSSVCCPVKRRERSAAFAVWKREKHREAHWLAYLSRSRTGDVRHFHLFIRGCRIVWVRVPDPPAPNSPAQSRHATITVSWAHNRRGHR